MTLTLSGGLVVRSIRPPVVERADVVVGAERVLAVGSCDSPNGARIDVSGCVVVPGNVNAHTHAYSALARGMPYTLDAPTSFLEILQRIWWRLDRALDEHSLLASARVAAREALLAGSTTLIDHHASPNAVDGSLDVIAQAFEEVGIRSALCYEVSDRDGRRVAGAGIRENERFIHELRAWPRRLTEPMVGAHACFTMTDETLGACVDLARINAAGLHIHAAEDSIDAGAVRRLGASGGLTASTLLAHAVHVAPDEIRAVRDSDTFVAHNARSNMNNAVGRAPVAAFGARVALGTDGLDSDMFEETRSGYFQERETTLEATPDRALQRLANGATLAGQIFSEPLLGTITTGAPADIIVLDYSPPTTFDATDLDAHWVFGISSRNVRDVVVGGELVVRDRHLTRADEDDIAAQARVQAQRLWERFEKTPVHEFTSVANDSSASRDVAAAGSR